MRILNYTRLPLEDAIYANRLAYSMHLALWDEEQGCYTALNHNSGVLFVKATENEDGSLNPKSLKNPWLFSMAENGYGVFAVRTLAEGEDDTQDLGTAVFWTSKDLVRYEECGLIKLADAPLREVRCAYEPLQEVRCAYGSLQEVRCSYGSAEIGKRDSAYGERTSGENDVMTGCYRLQWQQSDGSWHEAMIGDPKALASYDADQKVAGRVIREAEVLPAMMSAGNINAQGIAGIEGAVPRNVLEIPDELGKYLRMKLMPAENTGIEMSDELRIVCPKNDPGYMLVNDQRVKVWDYTGEGCYEEEVRGDMALPALIQGDGRVALRGYRVNALYSDGSRVPKPINWDMEELGKINFMKRGRYVLHGRVHQLGGIFPIATDRADPCVCRWQGKYYYIATNDADGNHTLYMRCTDSLEGIENAEEHLILDSSTYEDVGGLLWAPEFHEIDGKLYLFHACTPGPFFCEESHLMELREGGDPLCKGDWSRPRRIVRKDGSELCERGKVITLDMTEFEWQGELYVIWSQRQFLPKDLGAWLYIAKLNREKPWMLDSDPVLLSKPEYGWANNHTFVDEGPFALIRGDRLFVTFSSAAVDSTYVVGLLQIEKGKDLLVRENWYKNNYPLFTSRSYEGEYGTGHNAYVTDEDGTVWNTYHARPGVDGPRSTGFRRVHFDVDGEPMLDVTAELDLKEEFTDVETVVVVEGDEPWMGI